MKNQDNKISPTFVIIAVLFTTFLLIANIAANRLIEIKGIVLTGDLFLFPITYIFGDVLTEVYGFRKSRLIIWLGMIANLIMIGYFSFLLKLPFPSDFINNTSYENVLGAVPVIVFASILAYLTGEFANSAALSIIKKVTKGRYLWIRTIGSTLFGQVADTLTFMLIAFNYLPSDVLMQMILIQYFFKVGYEVIATPITYQVVNWLKRKENLDTYDYGVKYNPFHLDTTK